MPPAYKYLALDMPEKIDTNISEGETTNSIEPTAENQEGRVASATDVRPSQGVDEPQHHRSKKWERSPNNVLDVEKTAAIPTSTDEEVTGLITMEDVIEELLQV